MTENNLHKPKALTKSSDACSKNELTYTKQQGTTRMIILQVLGFLKVQCMLQSRDGDWTLEGPYFPIQLSGSRKLRSHRTHIYFPRLLCYDWTYETICSTPDQHQMSICNAEIVLYQLTNSQRPICSKFYLLSWCSFVSKNNTAHGINLIVHLL